MEIIKEIPSLSGYQTLCSAVGWAEVMNFEAAELSLKHSIFGITIKENEKIIGMGRIIGDGAIYFYIQDIVVHPDYQKQGIGHLIMRELMDYLKENAPDKAFVGLFASEGNESFYKKYTFKDYSPNMTGMFTVIER
ncbi:MULTISPECIES: GNAT family N-acetyltransferase [Vagococcus]|uniref:Ribosomal-protein-alanine acetyltransferase n=1 Tax=Vagococcus fluvialis bH819 TaxID=1255619 RepID=A0A1X6WLG2_9ENTE|nr:MULTISPECIES: GNAT family N-acetyltransferase [Vagococcus]SLM85100.1 Ribosomal-protein-alanine acetyltransferase [Vagococcus fluvialis bH819]HCM88484.1 N-acetyltransferase [Vagococcus sp.]